MGRFFIALPFAVLVSYGLVGLMAWMVDLNTKDLASQEEPLRFDIFVNESEQLSSRKNRELPKLPEKKPQPPEQKQLLPRITNTRVTPTLEPLPAIEMDLTVAEMNITVPAIAAAKVVDVPMVEEMTPLQVGLSQQIMPLRRIDPIYPRKALRRKIQGFVLLSFDIDQYGTPKNIKVTEAQPAKIFNREALKALKKWKYQPMIVNGVAQERSNQQIKLEFKIQ